MLLQGDDIPVSVGLKGPFVVPSFLYTLFNAFSNTLAKLIAYDKLCQITIFVGGLHEPLIVGQVRAPFRILEVVAAAVVGPVPVIRSTSWSRWGWTLIGIDC